MLRRPVACAGASARGCRGLRRRQLHQHRRAGGGRRGKLSGHPRDQRGHAAAAVRHPPTRVRLAAERLRWAGRRRRAVVSDHDRRRRHPQHQRAGAAACCAAVRPLAQQAERWTHRERAPAGDEAGVGGRRRRHAAGHERDGQGPAFPGVWGELRHGWVLLVSDAVRGSAGGRRREAHGRRRVLAQRRLQSELAAALRVPPPDQRRVLPQNLHARGGGGRRGWRGDRLWGRRVRGAAEVRAARQLGRLRRGQKSRGGAGLRDAVGARGGHRPVVHGRAPPRLGEVEVERGHGPGDLQQAQPPVDRQGDYTHVGA
mmetsp:Transcript_45249/g.119541  ORF Transcript_45249/g.119541 Transcript_45249/m.119541 type:complete len:314 (+) Transcript_45249:248-1189(+)